VALVEVELVAGRAAAKAVAAKGGSGAKGREAGGRSFAERVWGAAHKINKEGHKLGSRIAVVVQYWP
jgi:hypothetical protein